MLRIFSAVVLFASAEFTIVSCKKLPNGQSSLESLDNFAAQNNLVTNACKGQDINRQGIIVNSLMKKVFPAINPHQETLRDVFSAIPPDLAELFLSLEGEIILSSFPERYCDVSRSGSYEVQACYRHVPPSGNQRRILQVVVPADDRHIGHALLRQFGYLVAQELSSPSFVYDSKTMSEVPLATRIRSIGSKKLQVAEAFVNDVMSSSFLGNVDSEKLFGGGSNVGMSGGRFSWNQLTMGEPARSRLSDSIFAEAFDSYYCRAYEPVTDGMVAPFGRNTKMTTDELKTALSNIKNSRVRASLLFTQTTQAMNIVMPEIFEGRSLATSSSRGRTGAANGIRTGLGLVEQESAGLGLQDSGGCEVDFDNLQPYVGRPDPYSIPLSTRLNVLQNKVEDTRPEVPAASNESAASPAQQETKVFDELVSSGERSGGVVATSYMPGQGDAGPSALPEEISYPKLGSQSLAGSPQVEGAVSAGLPSGAQAELFEERNTTLKPAEPTSGLALGDSLLTRCIKRTEAAQRLERRAANAAGDVVDAGSDAARSAVRVADTSVASAVITKGGVIGGKSAKSEFDAGADAIRAGSAPEQVVQTLTERQAGLEASMRRMQDLDESIATLNKANKRSTLDEVIDNTPNNGQSPLDQAIANTTRNQNAASVEQMIAKRAKLQQKVREEAKGLRKEAEETWRRNYDEVNASSQNAYGVRGELAEVMRQKMLLAQAREVNGRFSAAYGAERRLNAPQRTGDAAKDLVDGAVHDALNGIPAEEMAQLERTVQSRLNAARDRLTKTYNENKRELQTLERRMEEYPSEAKSIMERRVTIEAEQQLLREKVIAPRNIPNTPNGKLLDAIIENNDVESFWRVVQNYRN